MIGQSADKSYAYLLGVYLGDGCVTNTPDGYPVFRLNTIDADFADAAKQAIACLSRYSININVHAVKKSSKLNHSLRCGDTGLCRRLRNDAPGKRTLPAGILDWPREHQLAFIAGLMDSEGFVAANSTNPTNRRFYMGFKSCDPWVPDFIVLLQRLGVRIGKVQIEEPYRPGYKPPTRFTIKMQSWIDAGCYFNIRRKQDRVEEWAFAGAYEHRARRPRRLISETTRQTPAQPVMI